MCIMSDLIRKLETMNKGSNTHTINKTIFYLEKAKKKGYDEVYKELEAMAKDALLTNDWKPLSKRMARWF